MELELGTFTKPDQFRQTYAENKESPPIIGQKYGLTPDRRDLVVEIRGDFVGDRLFRNCHEVILHFLVALNPCKADATPPSIKPTTQNMPTRPAATIHLKLLSLGFVPGCGGLAAGFMPLFIFLHNDNHPNATHKTPIR